MRNTFLFALVVGLLFGISSRGDEMTNRLEGIRPELVREFSVPVEQWRFHQPAVAGDEQGGFDDSAWASAAPGFTWSAENTNASFRAKITIPATVGGLPVEGKPVRLQLGLTGRTELYVDGAIRDDFRGDNGQYTLADKAHAGQTFSVTLHPRGQADGRFRFARLYCDVLPDFDRYLDEVTFVDLLLNKLPADQRALVQQALDASEQAIQFTNVTPDNLSSVRDQLAKARVALGPIASITRKYDVYYVGHAHIDMNWLWTWPETIDVCHRTWNSAMNLMDEFPAFQFVQSQPGAYVPIQKQFPEEFARMQAMSAKGQWDVVGGLWDESDSDIPSGEGLARSFLLGQRYFKDNFGKYAVTGWLPDSFGHSWQLPQIMKLCGIQNFYHMRCGNNMEFTWWESPDGSRVLKANTPSYDTKPTIEQLIVPWENEARFNVPESLVIFGVGDHGGGPTREQILRIQSFQQDPIFPHVHFISADDFFAKLASQPVAASLPVVDTDLQYTFEGCYTTHAGLKKELRESENNLYSAEVLSSLAAMAGQTYPVAEFNEAWKPTAFAQFHDIAAGSAIHSTYDWMHDELAPAFKFEQEQTDKSLEALNACADTRGPGANAIVVWNTLSFQRDDVVRAQVADAAQYHSVVNSQGRSFAAQADGDALVFVARAVPAFGCAVYFPRTDTCAGDGVVLHDKKESYEVETPGLTLQIAKATGALTKFYSKAANWDVFSGAKDADALQLLGDSGTAWTIKYTGDERELLADKASVSVVDNGPVFARVRVSHAYGKSTYTQDVTVYGALPRVDIPTTVDWQENAELLKIRLPLNAAHPAATAQIPSGNIARPINGQESPCQKWVDVSEMLPEAPTDGTPLDLAGLFNSSCGQNFDGNGGTFPGGRLPRAGVHKLGENQVPFQWGGGGASGDDNVVTAGQKLSVPANVTGDTVYLLAACANGSHWTEMGFQMGDGSVTSEAFPLNEWKSGNFPDDEAGLVFPDRQPSARRKAVPATIWIAKVPFPQGATGLILPNDARVHIFAATIGTRPPAPAVYGLSVLNDSKYGFDVSSNVLRLTALRSSGKPDPHPDNGTQVFTYSLYPHVDGWQEARTDEQALGLNIPLLARVTTAHAPAGRVPVVSITNVDGKGDLVVSALKHSEDGDGYVLRFYEADGQDTLARVDFGGTVRSVEETDILERPLARQPFTFSGNPVTVPVGHNQIVTLHLVMGR